MAVNDVGETPFQRSDGFFLGLALSQFAFIEHATLRMWVVWRERLTSPNSGNGPGFRSGRRAARASATDSRSGRDRTVYPWKVPRVSVNGLSLHYREAGRGPPVVLVHGWPTDSRLWDGQIPVLAARHRVIAPDFPGFGQSDRPEPNRIGLDLLQRSLIGLMDAVGLEQASFVGHDLGGPAVLLTAIRNPERVERLAVLDTTPYPDLPRLIRRMVRGAKVPGISALMVSRWGIRLMFRIGTANPQTDTSRLVDLFRPKDRAGRRALVDALRHIDFRDLEEVAAGLKGIGMPMLILWAEGDPTGPLSLARRFAADVPGSMLETVPDCGHFLPVDRPEAVAQALVGFLG